MKNLNYLINHILHQIFKIVSNTTKQGEKTDNSPIRIYINKIEKSIIFKIKAWYYLELLTSETIKLL